MPGRKNRFSVKKLIAVLCVISILSVLGYKGHYKIMRMMYPLKYEEYIEKYSAENNLDPALVFAVIKCESDFDSSAKSKIGAMGLMQITPETFSWLQSKTKEKLKSSALYDPETSIKYGTLLLSRHISEFGDEKTALAAYHAGRGQVNHWLSDREVSKDGKTLDTIPFTDTRSYVGSVMKAQNTYKKLYKTELN